MTVLPVFFIQGPISDILLNIFTNVSKVGFIPDNALKIIALP